MNNTPIISEFFRIGTAGPTVDGREISPDMLSEMAESYDPEEYKALINVEHINGLSYYNEFPSLGEVVELKTDKDKKGRVVLMARVSPSTQLINMNSRSQKLFPSMEISPNFSGTQKAYLTGLAMTDRPASLGTQSILYAARNGGPAEDRFKTNYFSQEIETEPFAMTTPKSDRNPENNTPAAADPSNPDDETSKKSFAEKFAEIFKPAEKKSDDKFAQMEEASLTLAGKVSEIETNFAELKTENDALSKTVKAQEAQISEFKTALENTPEDESQTYTPRPDATGEAVNLTDC